MLRVKIKKKTFGSFTLIELLVVMAVISLLAGISLFALRGARSSSEDARRKADLQQIASALELFKSDCRYYPNSLPNPGQSITDDLEIWTDVPCRQPSASQRIYLQSTPDDPDPSLNYRYEALGCTVDTPSGYWGYCTRFRLSARLDNPPTTLPSYCDDNGYCGGVNLCNYCIINP